MSDFLQQMATSSAARCAAEKRDISEADLLQKIDALPAPLAFRTGGFDVIAEIKERSPAEGELSNAGIHRTQRARLYANAGAAAISVLTEPERFDGALAHLSEVAAAVPDCPVMRKDFLVDPYQILQARAAGADGVLMIVAMLDDAALAAMLRCAVEHRLFILLEAFDADDLERAKLLIDDSVLAGGQILLGVNTRDLRTLAVDSERLAALAPLLPGDIACVAESGVLSADAAADAARLGYRLALVGTALMRSEKPGVLVETMVAAGRAAIRRQ